MNDHSAPPEAAARNRPLPGPGAPASDAKRLHLLTRVASSRTFPARTSRTPGVTPAPGDAACIDRSMDGSAQQRHNSMGHIILAS